MEEEEEEEEEEEDILDEAASHYASAAYPLEAPTSEESAARHIYAKCVVDPVEGAHYQDEFLEFVSLDGQELLLCGELREVTPTEQRAATASWWGSGCKQHRLTRRRGAAGNLGRRSACVVMFVAPRWLLSMRMRAKNER